MIKSSILQARYPPVSYGSNPQLISVVAGRLVNNPERIRMAAGLRKYDRIVPDAAGPERTCHLRVEPILKTVLLVDRYVVGIVQPVEITASRAESDFFLQIMTR